jgi:hypothetical protein
MYMITRIQNGKGIGSEILFHNYLFKSFLYLFVTFKGNPKTSNVPSDEVPTLLFLN